MALMEQAYLMVVSQQFVQKVNRLVTDEALVFVIDEAMPTFLRESAQDIIVLGIKVDLILVQILKEVFSPENFGNLHQLVRIAVTVEERLFPEYHGREHSAQRPHIKGVVVLLKIHEKLWSFEISGSHTHIVFCALMVEFGESPIN